MSLVAYSDFQTYLQAADNVSLSPNGLKFLSFIQPKVEAAIKKFLGFDAEMPFLTPPVVNQTPNVLSGGTLSAGTYYYVVTAVSSTSDGLLAGETTASNEVSATVLSNNSVQLAWTPVTLLQEGSVPVSATSYNVYRGGSGAEVLIAKGVTAATYTDAGAAPLAPSTAPPQVNTAVVPAVELQPELMLESSYDGGSVILGSWDMIGGNVIGRARGDRWQNAIQLRQLPVRTIVSIYENYGAWSGPQSVYNQGYFPASSLLPNNSYYLDMATPGFSTSGAVYRVAGIWSSAPRTVQVTYTYGYTPQEIDAMMPNLRLATLIALAHEYIAAIALSKAVKAGPITYLGVKDASVTFDHAPFAFRMSGLPPRTKALLSGYVNMSRYF